MNKFEQTKRYFVKNCKRFVHYELFENISFIYNDIFIECHNYKTYKKTGWFKKNIEMFETDEKDKRFTLRVYNTVITDFNQSQLSELFNMLLYPNGRDYFIKENEKTNKKIENFFRGEKCQQQR